MNKSFTKHYGRAITGLMAVLLSISVVLGGGVLLTAKAAAGEVLNFAYTGSVQSAALTSGSYLLEVWGAGRWYSADAGGYSAGTFTLTQQTTVYIVVGGSSGQNSQSGGYNGGGAGGNTGGPYPINTNGRGGGGATHIATATGLLSQLSGNQGAVLLVGGGAGGDGGYSGTDSTFKSGGNGGGISGNAGVNGARGTQAISPGGSGATATAGGDGGTAAGRAASEAYDATNTTYGGGGGGGGGGWYGGGGAAGGTAVAKYSYTLGGAGTAGSFGVGGRGGYGAGQAQRYADCAAGGGGGGSGYAKSTLQSAAVTTPGEDGFISKPSIADRNGYARITNVVPTLDLTEANELITQANNLRQVTDGIYTNQSVSDFIEYVDETVVPLVNDIQANGTGTHTQAEVDETVGNAPSLLTYSPPDLTGAMNLLDKSQDLSAYTEETAAIFLEYVTTEIQPLVTEVEQNIQHTQNEIDTAVSNAPELKLKPRTFLITLDVNGDITELYYTEEGELPDTPQNPITTDSTFLGWYNADTLISATWTLSEWQSFIESLESSITLTAKFKPYIKITFMNAESISPLVLAPHDDLSNLRPNPSKKGYAFSGWFRESNYTTPFNFDTESVPETDITLYALWTAKIYTVEYDFNGGTFSSSTPILTVTYDALYSFTVPARDHYSFVGWFGADGVKQYTGPDGRGNNLPWSEAPADGIVRLRAQWNIMEYTLKLNTDDDRGRILFVTHAYNELIPEEKIPAAPVRDFAIFQGWFMDDNTKFDFVTRTMPEYGGTLYAKWVPDTARLQNLVNECTGYLTFTNFESTLFQNFLNAMNGANEVLGIETKTVEGVKTAHTTLMDTIIALKIVYPGTENVIPANEFRPSVVLWPYILLAVILITTTAAIILLVLAKKKKAAAV